MTLKTETWQQDPYDPNLWHGAGGVLVNTAALEARAEYFEVKRIVARPSSFDADKVYGLGA